MPFIVTTDELNVPFLLALALAAAPTASASSDDPEIARLKEIGAKMQAAIDASAHTKSPPPPKSKPTLDPEIERILHAGEKFGKEQAPSQSPQVHMTIPNSARMPWNGKVALAPGSPEWFADRDARTKAAWDQFWQNLLYDHIESLGIFLVCLAHAAVLAFFAGKRRLRPAPFALVASISSCLICYFGWYPYLFRFEETIFSPNALSGYVIFMLITAAGYFIGSRQAKIYLQSPSKNKPVSLR
ncbi:hypothetical protein [Novosphingobium sp. AAP93]|uniref:hypothetical protein n=1 Tax=Novosphingobium sp. AAP93 TaxID=1523427 RepID=UPI000B2A10A8|nr:hypothetical protein [Novosphingobium sp. AAP93]